MNSNTTLTFREAQVVKEATKGLSNKEIASKLNRSVDTVKHHLKNSMRKLGVSNRVALSVLATITHQVNVSAEEIISASKHLLIYLGLAFTFSAAFSTVCTDDTIARNLRTGRPANQRNIKNSGRFRKEQNSFDLLEVC